MTVNLYSGRVHREQWQRDRRNMFSFSLLLIALVLVTTALVASTLYPSSASIAQRVEHAMSAE